MKKNSQKVQIHLYSEAAEQRYLGKFEYKYSKKKGTNTIVTQGGTAVVTNDGKLECLSFLPIPVCRLFSTNCQECVFFAQCPVLVMFFWGDKGV